MMRLDAIFVCCSKQLPHICININLKSLVGLFFCKIKIKLFISFLKEVNISFQRKREESF